MAIRVLVVDDEEDFLTSIVMRLGLRDMVAHGVKSGDEALRFLARETVDVVVLDIKMPGLDGIAALGVIKERHPAVEVIVLTGHASEKLSETGIELGAFDYLIKPVKLDTVMERIQAAYERATKRTSS